MNKYLGNYETSEENNHLTLHQMDKFLTACTSFNTGLCEIYKFKIDNDFTLDENLNDFIEYIEEEETKIQL